MSSIKIEFDFDIPVEIQNDLQWKNPDLNLIRGFIITKCIQIESLIDRLMLCLKLSNKNDQKSYFEKKRRDVTFGLKINALLRILQENNEIELSNKLEIVLEKIIDIRNRIAHDNWVIITDKVISLKDLQIDTESLKQFQKNSVVASVYLTKLYQKYGGFNDLIK